MPMHRPRRPVLSIVGSAGDIPEPVRQAGLELGALAMNAGLRILSGGRDGVMAAVSEGARRADTWTEGSVMGILMGYDRAEANPWLDVVLPTGMGFARNTLVVAGGDVVVALSGGAGTLSEMALAWQIGRPVIALEPTGGWAGKLAGQRLDDRFEGPVHRATSPAEVITLTLTLLPPELRPQ